MSLHDQSREIELYYYIFLNNINIKTAKLFMKFFIKIKDIHGMLYDKRNKLFSDLKMDIKKSLNISTNILR